MYRHGPCSFAIIRAYDELLAQHLSEIHVQGDLKMWGTFLRND